MKKLKCLTICIALLFLFTGNVFAQVACNADLLDMFSPNGGEYMEGETIQYNFTVSAPEEGCDITNVKVRFFPPNDPPIKPNSPCDIDSVNGVLINLGSLANGDPDLFIDSSFNPIMDYTVESADADSENNLNAYVCFGFASCWGGSGPVGGCIGILFASESSNSLVDEWCEASGGDSDIDGICDDVDSCPYTYNPAQTDWNNDGLGDSCDEKIHDKDGDGVDNRIDNCIKVINFYQLDADGDGVGDVCDDTPGCGGCGQPVCEEAL
jgi:hypothetical protein